MESEFIALDKAREEAERLRQLLKDIPLWQKSVPLYEYTAIIKQLYLGHKMLYTTVNLGIFIVDIILLSSCSQMELSLLILSHQKII